eukprot:gnl/MRDRNA2_/MRDRNA2_226754_c0_seq1.p1 gnl/MRDRNA2_/MRDRNA2_226754_c0~~gnl/MRDRNA2_/MRDRNA2_226754_c0_seq1.p1  ORF type:complete len:879 (+),score=152.07 gnl/MRDRNA2_/MRDRNA2_226754_c0_seq1:130-2637(+)
MAAIVKSKNNEALPEFGAGSLEALEALMERQRYEGCPPDEMPVEFVVEGAKKYHLLSADAALFLGTTTFGRIGWSSTMVKTCEASWKCYREWEFVLPAGQSKPEEGVFIREPGTKSYIDAMDSKLQLRGIEDDELASQPPLRFRLVRFSSQVPHLYYLELIDRPCHGGENKVVTIGQLGKSKHDRIDFTRAGVIEVECRAPKNVKEGNMNGWVHSTRQLFWIHATDETNSHREDTIHVTEGPVQDPSLSHDKVGEVVESHTHFIDPETEIGHGYLLVDEETRKLSSCISNFEVSHGEHSPWTTSFTYRRVSSKEDIVKSFSLGAVLPTEWGVKIGLALEHSGKQSSESDHFLLDVTHIQRNSEELKRTASGQGITWNPRYKDGSPSYLHRTCGDGVVTSIDRGGVMMALITMTKSSSDSGWKGTLGLESPSPVQVNADFVGSMRDFIKKGSVSIETWTTIGDGNFDLNLGGDFEKLLEQAERFPAMVEKSPRKLRGVVQEYVHLVTDMPHAVRTGIDSRESVRLTKALAKARSDLTESADFFKPWRRKIAKEHSDILKCMKEYSQLAEEKLTAVSEAQKTLTSNAGIQAELAAVEADALANSNACRNRVEILLQAGSGKGKSEEMVVRMFPVILPEWGYWFNSQDSHSAYNDFKGPKQRLVLTHRDLRNSDMGVPGQAAIVRGMSGWFFLPRKHTESTDGGYLMCAVYKEKAYYLVVDRSTKTSTALKDTDLAHCRKPPRNHEELTLWTVRSLNKAAPQISVISPVDAPDQALTRVDSSCWSISSWCINAQLKDLNVGEEGATDMEQESQLWEIVNARYVTIDTMNQQGNFRLFH